MKRHAPAKVNIFLKVTGTRGGYHEIRSRFVLVESLFDTISFVKKSAPSLAFELICETPLPGHNTVSEAYRLLLQETPVIEKFFNEYAVALEKRIPMGGGLGGGSSDAAAFLHLCNEVCYLGMSDEKLALVGEKIGADVPFFVYGYKSANVEGIGEIIEPFEEEPLKLKLFTPPIHCDTAAVYREFRKGFIETVDRGAAREWLKIPSRQIMESVAPTEANDLYAPALKLYPELKEFAAPGRFFSGSGSTHFWMGSGVQDMGCRG